ncbi:MAG: hypothetical protein K8S87_09930 [Planctomycetes bacterium]|nr:hypothetical protein [Planctomycetota bacterium]
MKKLFLLIISIVFLASTSHADIAPDPINSRGLTPIKDTKVQMVSEEIKVELNPAYAKVYCKFIMKNTGGKETLEVGFPNINLGYHGYNRNIKEKDLKDFEVKVGGEKIDCMPKFKIDKKSEKIKPKKDDKSKYNKWFIWEMTFKKGEEKTVEVKYKQPFGQKYSEGIFGKRYFSYVLDTGAGWHGKIKKAKIEIKLKDLTKENVISASPKGYKLKSKEIRWEMKNIEPTSEHNIRVDYKAYKDYSSALKARKDNIKSWQDAWVVLHCAVKAKQFDGAEDLLTKGIKFSDEQKWGREKKEGREIALYQQIAKIRYLIFEEKKTDESKKNALVAFDKLKELTKKLMKLDDEIEKLFIFKGFDKGIYKWIIETDLCDEDFITSWKGPSMFESRWKSGIKKAADTPEKPADAP